MSVAATELVHQGHDTETVDIQRVPLTEIVMPGFQRERILPHIMKLAAEWDATAYAFPMVALFKDEHIALDGQQRLAAAELLGMEEVDVLLVQGVRTPDRLARIFLHVNRDRKLLTALEKYIGALGAKDQGTRSIERIVRSFGLQVGKSATAHGRIPAGAVVTIHERGGNGLLERTLLIRDLAWARTPSREAHESKTLLGLAAFLRRYGGFQGDGMDKVDDDRLVAVLAKHHPGYILDRTSKAPTISYADYLREQYNKGLRGGKKL